MEISLQIITPLAKQPIDSYLVLVDALTNAENYSRSDQDRTAFERVLYQLAVASQWGTFDALSECIKRENAPGDDTNSQDRDRIVQLVSRTAGKTIELALTSFEYRAILPHFAHKLVLTPCAGSSTMMVSLLPCLLGDHYLMLMFVSFSFF